MISSRRGSGVSRGHARERLHGGRAVVFRAGMQVLYAHGFASGPSSAKGVAVRAHLAARGVSCALLDLRVPDRDRLRLSAMIDVVRAAITGDEPVLGVGSSLGGLTMAHAAMRDPRITRLLLLAPAFGIAARWRARLGEARWASWRGGEAMVVDDHTGGPPLRVDHGFARDLEAVDATPPTLRPEVPVTLVHGVNDDTVDVAVSREFVARTPHARLVEVDDDHALVASLPRILAELDALLV